MGRHKLPYYTVRSLKYALRSIIISVMTEGKRLLAKAQDLYYERKLGVNTIGAYDVDKAAGMGQDAFWYVATSHARLDCLVRHLALTKDDVFLDLGCGKGRVICRVGMETMGKVIGIDLDETLVEIARKNAAGLRDRKTEIEVIHGDAATFDVKDITIFYMYKPFGWKTLTEVLKNIRESLEVNPRKIRILYCNREEFGVLLDMCDWLIPKGEIGKTEIFEWRNR